MAPVQEAPGVSILKIYRATGHLTKAGMLPDSMSAGKTLRGLENMLA